MFRLKDQSGDGI